MTSFFFGGASGSAASAALYSHAGWNGVCTLGAALGGAATALWLWQGAAGEGSGRAKVAAAAPPFIPDG
jgi:hypothetical protein